MPVATLADAGRAPRIQEPRPHLFTTLASMAMDDLTTAATWMRRTRCGLGGHSMLLQFEPNRLSMRCHSCGAETPGWSIGAT